MARSGKQLVCAARSKLRIEAVTQNMSHSILLPHLRSHSFLPFVNCKPKATAEERKEQGWDIDDINQILNMGKHGECLLRIYSDAWDRRSRTPNSPPWQLPIPGKQASSVQFPGPSS